MLRGNKSLTGALAGGADWFAALMSLAAFVVLYRFKADVLWVVIAGGAVGLARTIFFG